MVLPPVGGDRSDGNEKEHNADYRPKKTIMSLVKLGK